MKFVLDQIVHIYIIGIYKLPVSIGNENIIL